MLNKSILDKYKYYLLILFVVIQPILDIHYLYTEEVVNAIGFSPSTIIRIIIIGILGILTLLTVRDKKLWIVVGVYLSLIGIYTILHILNARNFYTLVPNDLGYSVSGELFYIIRMLIPIAVIFVTITTDISKKDYIKAVKIILLLISGSIIVSNIFKFSLQSYGQGIISGNIFDWFNGGYLKYNYEQLASRGPFNSANQLSALLVLLLPTMFGIYTYDKKVSNLITILLTILSMIMIGTKVALYGAIIVVVVYVFMLLISTMLKQGIKIDKNTLALIGLSIILIGSLYTKSPSINRGMVESGYKANTESQEANKDLVNKQEIDKKPEIADQNTHNKENLSKKDIMIKYIEDNFIDAKIKYDFITKHYPYQYDPEFWMEIMDLPLEKRTDYRYLELRMHQRVMELNNNPNDKLFGISFTRTEHLFTLERDFIYQYYSLGIIGVMLFLGPYVLLTLASMFKIIVYLIKRKFDINISMTCFGIVFILGVSVYSGNVMDALTITIILGFIIGILTKQLFIQNGEY